MTRRKGEYTLSRIKRDHPFAIVVPSEALSTSVRLQAAYPSMASRHAGLRFNDRAFLICYFKDADDAERFRSAAHGWTYDKAARDDRSSTVWPPRNPRAAACD
jgi:hypothetical protein